jgi:antirestriction protein ArdC
MNGERHTVWDVITDRIIAQLEAGVVPWRKPWNARAGMPKNFASGKEYRGINPFLLHSLGYESPYFLTFRQAKARGGHVRKGERGCPVVFWKWFTPKNQSDTNDPGYALPRRDPDGRVILPMLRYYTVFNVAQCEGIEAPALNISEREHTAIEAAEHIAANMPNGPRIRSNQRAASYDPISDSVSMPRPEVFASGEGFYATLLHELTHSTGHASRLDRKGITEEIRFGSPTYSREELVAEMGAAFLCGEAGILETQLDQSVAYIDNWLHQLRNDRKLVVVAAAQAQKAADYILGRKYDEQ